MSIEELMDRAEHAIVEAQFRVALQRLEEYFVRCVQTDDDLRQARAFIEKLHLMAGDRRHKHVEVQLDRRHNYEN